MEEVKFPKVVCLCGSTKFKKEFEEITMDESLKGHVVLSVGCFAHHDNIRISDKEKEELDILHKRKIDMADEIIVINVNGYIGDSTKSEIKYAKEHGKSIVYLVEPGWYEDGTEEELGEVDIKDEELQDFFKAIYKVFDKEKLQTDLIKKLENEIDENNKRSLDVIDTLLNKLTELAESYLKDDPTYINELSWTTFFDFDEERKIKDLILNILPSSSTLSV